jgi:hypothetical protein
MKQEPPPVSVGSSQLYLVSALHLFPLLRPGGPANHRPQLGVAARRSLLRLSAQVSLLAHLHRRQSALRSVARRLHNLWPGFTAVFLILALLYANAYRQRAKLELNIIESFDTASDIWGNISVAAVGLGSIALAQFPATIGLAGFFYFAIAIVRTTFGALRRRRRRPLEERFLAAVRVPK